MWRHNALFFLNIATIAIIILINAAAHTISKIVISPIVSYFNAVWSGSEDPFWPHVTLVPLSVLAGVAVGFAIFADHPRLSPRFSATVHTIALWCLIVGVPTESICTVLLFVIDERISTAEQKKIAYLETPRTLTRVQERALTSTAGKYAGTTFETSVAPDAESVNLLIQIEDALLAAKWTQIDWPSAILFPSHGHASSAIALEVGIRVVWHSDHEAELRAPALAIAKALESDGLLDAVAAPANASDPTDHKTIAITIGAKPLQQ
ncbi:MAG TPA: hypothetical protein VNE82_11895 [Candidatus Binataceae bacterium]|nr:hypothetical protein [Candidatus Binataceae bacterium]